MLHEQIFEPHCINLHTHSVYCGHGSGTIGAYVAAAKESQLEVLGMSEHAPVPENRWSHTRMDYKELPIYAQDVESHTQQEKLILLKGMECDYLPEYHHYYQEELLGRYQCDYLIGAVHFLNAPGLHEYFIQRGPLGKREFSIYTDHYIEMLQSGLFLFGAHPDVFGGGHQRWDAEAQACARAIIEAAQATSTPLEINGNGFLKRSVDSSSGQARPYPLEAFWELAAEYQIKVVVNSDAHHPKNLVAPFAESFALAARVGLSPSSLALQSIGDQYQVRYL